MAKATATFRQRALQRGKVKPASGRKNPVEQINMTPQEVRRMEFVQDVGLVFVAMRQHLPAETITSLVWEKLHKWAR